MPGMFDDTPYNVHEGTMKDYEQIFGARNPDAMSWDDVMSAINEAESMWDKGGGGTES